MCATMRVHNPRQGIMTRDSFLQQVGVVQNTREVSESSFAASVRGRMSSIAGPTMTRLLLLAGLSLLIPCAQGALLTQINLCAQSYPTATGAVLNCMGSSDSGQTSVVTELAYDVADLVDPPGSYSGYGYISMTPDTFRLKGSVTLADYARKNRVNI